MSPTRLAPPGLSRICDLMVQVAAPIEAGTVQGLATHGRRRIIPITGGQVRGHGPAAALTGEVLAGGADFQLVLSETCAELDARYIIRLADGTHVHVHNRAIRRGSAADIAALVRGEPVDPARIYFRCAPRLEVEHPDLQWLTQTVLIGTGARHPDRVVMSFFSVD